MTERPILRLKTEQIDVKPVVETSATITTSIAASVPDVVDISCLGAGSIPKILQLSGAYNSHGSFKPQKGKKPAIGEPRMRDVYWCRFTDAINPEFGKERPVIILSKKSPLGTFSLVVPITTEDEGQTPDNSHRLSKNPNPNGGHPSWVVASHVYSVSHWRMRRFWDTRAGTLVTPRVSEEDFDRVLEILHNKIPACRPIKNLKSAADDGISIIGIHKTMA